MKAAILPQVRVSTALREAAEAALAPGESLSELVEQSVRRTVELRRLDREFEARAGASLRAHEAGAASVGSDELLDELRRMTARRRGELGLAGPAPAVHEPVPPPYVPRAKEAPDTSAAPRPSRPGRSPRP